MPNHMKFCGCNYCRRGRKASSAMIKSEIRKNRRKVKISLRTGKEPPDKFSVPYTD